MCLFVVVVTLVGVLKVVAQLTGFFLDFSKGSTARRKVSVIIRAMLGPLAWGKQGAVDCLKGFPAIIALAHAQPVLVFDLREDVRGEGFLDCWHHVVHHCENIKTQSRKTYKPFFKQSYSQFTVNKY